MQGEDVNFASALDPASEALKKAQSEITNDQVKTAYDKLVTSFEGTKKTLEGVDLSAFADISDLKNFDPSAPGATDKLDELQKKSDELQKQANDLQTDLQADQKELTDAVGELNKVCSAG